MKSSKGSQKEEEEDEDEEEEIYLKLLRVSASLRNTAMEKKLYRQEKQEFMLTI